MFFNVWMALLAILSVLMTLMAALFYAVVLIVGCLLATLTGALLAPSSALLLIVGLGFCIISRHFRRGE